MALSEFGLIQDYFADLDLGCAHVIQGVGDDCALLAAPRPGCELAISTDTLIGGVHFPGQAPANCIAERALAVNLSDLNAMGAEPYAFTLSITLPAVDTDWLADFARGLGKQALAYNIPLVGGDTTRGPLSITIHIIGQLPQGQALLRSGASVGDSIYVSGTLGDAAAALQLIKAGELHNSDAAYLLHRFYAPEIDFVLSTALRGIATSAIDVSDGLLADLRHILNSSRVGAVINVDDVPLSPEILRVGGEQQALAWALGGGDDYRLCFTMAAKYASALRRQGLQLTCIGEIVAGDGLRCQTADGAQYQPERSGYLHF